jgi:hypothetical protein
MFGIDGAVDSFLVIEMIGAILRVFHDLELAFSLFIMMLKDAGLLVLFRFLHDSLNKLKIKI